MVYSSTDAVALARKNPDKQVVFFAIGFETTTPPTAWRSSRPPRSEEFLGAVLPCADAIRPSPASSNRRKSVSGAPCRSTAFIGPAHVPTIIGSRPYEFFAEEYRKPVVIAGFEPLDVMQAIKMLIRQVNEGRAEVENEFARAVSREGNLKAQELVAEVFEMRKTFDWRGFAGAAYSALRIRGTFGEFGCRFRAFRWAMPRCRTTRPANAAPSCAASNGRRIARSSERCIRRRTRKVLHGVVGRGCAAHCTIGEV